MKQRKKLSDIYLQNFIKIIITLFISIFILWAFYDFFIDYRNPATSFKNFTINEKKNLLKEVVNNTITYIDYKYNLIENGLKAKIKEETYQASQIINTLYVRYNKCLPSDQNVSIIKDTLRAIKYQNGIGYFFAFDLNGIEQVFADRPELEGRNLLNLRDAKGNYVLQDMIKIVKEKKEGFYTYYWTKPGEKNKQLIYKKIAYIKYFKPLKWIIGTGLYFDDTEDEIQKSVKEYIKKLKFGKNNKGRIFIIQPIRENGKLHKIRYILPDKSPVTLKKILPDNNTIEGKIIKNNLLTKCFNSQEGVYTTCHLSSSLSGVKNNHKLTYSKYFKKWNWVIVAGVPLDDMYNIINAQKQSLLKSLLLKLFSAFIIILLAIFIAFKMFKKTNYQIKQDFLKIISKLKNNFALEKIDNKTIDTEELFEITEIVNSLIEHIEENNKILEAYFNKRNIVNYIINENGYFEKINATFTEKVGYSIEDLQNIYAFDIIHKDFKEEAKERTFRRLKGEYIEPYYECKVITKTGEEKWFLLITNHIYLESINKNIILGSAIEITDYKTLTEELNEQYNLFKTLIDSLHVPVWVFKAESNTFQTANKYFYEYFEMEKNVI